VLEAIAAHAPNFATKARQYVGGIVTYAIHHSLRDDGVPLSLRGVIPRHENGHIPAITKPAEIASLVQAINTYKSPITRGKHATHGFRGMLRTVGRERLGIDIDVLEAQLAHAKRGDVHQ